LEATAAAKIGHALIRKREKRERKAMTLEAGSWKPSQSNKHAVNLQPTTLHLPKPTIYCYFCSLITIVVIVIVSISQQQQYYQQNKIK
jgi:hypothetical protein